MKKIMLCLVFILPAVVYGPAVRAQFLKNLVNKVTQNMANKATGNPTGNGKDSAANAARDSAMLVGFMTNATKPKPMTAGDSAALKTFMTASGGGGMLYQYQTRYDFKSKTKDSVIQDTMSMALSDAHNTHTEMDMLGMKMTIIGHANQPKYSVVLYPESKSYKLNIIDTATLNNQGDSYQITKIGTETVAGYSCIHFKMGVAGKDKKLIVTEDIWTSTAVPGYAQLMKLTSNAHVTLKMMQAMESAGCAGFVVKMDAQSPISTNDHSLQFSTTMVLITAARKEFPASMFEIPAGYTVMTGQGLMNSMIQQQMQQQKKN